MSEMRENLFRGKKLGSGRWTEGDLLTSATYPDRAWITESKTFFDRQLDTIAFVEVDHSTVGQYTGLTDENGVKIFEGDILSIPSEQIGDMKAVVYYDTKYAGFNMKPITDFHYAMMKDGTIIGNIHDNPELAKGGSGE